MDYLFPGYVRAIRTAAWTWIIFLASLAVVDCFIYARSKDPLEPVIWYNVLNALPALVFLWLSYSKWILNNNKIILPSMILLITLVPILVNHLFELQLPPSPLSDHESLVLRALPVLLIGLVLVAWRYSLLVMFLYSILSILFDLFLIYILNRMGDTAHLTAVIFTTVLRTICFIVVGIFVNQLISNLRTLAVHDSLTGLFNRHYLNELLSKYMARAQREKTIITFALIDIDLFKHFNDIYGHQAGDSMLHGMGRFLDKNMRKGDVACRFGGEEFLLIMPGALPLDALKRIEQLRISFEAMRVKHGESLLNATFSAGIAAFPYNGDSMEMVIKNADDALFAAKQAGRNRVVCSKNMAAPDALEPLPVSPL